MANAGTPRIMLQGCKAGADYSAATNQYKIVKLNAARQVVLCTGTTDKPCGVLQNTPKSGMPAEVVALGETKLWGAAATTAGAELATDGSALAAVIVSGTDTTRYKIGYAIDTTAAAGGLITAMVDCISVGKAT